MKKDFMKILFVIIMGIIIFVVSKYISELDTTYLEAHDFFQYFGGIKVEYKGNLEISRKSKEITNLKTEDVKVELDSTPVFYGDIENKLLLPQDMAIVELKEKCIMKRITHFSAIQIEDEIPYIEREQNKKTLKKSFLFDGKDLYIFLTESTINVDGEVFELPPLSYAIVNYRQNVEIYNKKDDTYKIIETENGNIKATVENCEINLSTDAVTYNGKEQLLLKKIEVLPSFDWEG